jgi:hypothetical protein
MGFPAPEASLARGRAGLREAATCTRIGRLDA